MEQSKLAQGESACCSTETTIPNRCPYKSPPDSDGTVGSLKAAYQLSNRALIKAKERLEQLRNAMIAMNGAMSFQANWDDALTKRYNIVSAVMNLSNANLQSGQVSLNPKQKAFFATAIPTITGVLDRINSSLNLWGTGEVPFLMRSDLQPDYAYVFGHTRDDRYFGIELEKISFSQSGPLGSAATMLHERFHLTGAQHGENFFNGSRSRKPVTRRSRIRFAESITRKLWPFSFAPWRQN